MAVVPYLLSPFMGPSMVFMIVYVWSREFPNARINIYGLVSLKVLSLSLSPILSLAISFWKLYNTCCGVHTGILSSLGNAGSGFDFWSSFEARHSRDGCRTSLLLSNRASSSCWWKINAQDSSLGVSFYGSTIFDFISNEDSVDINKYICIIVDLNDE